MSESSTRGKCDWCDQAHDPVERLFTRWAIAIWATVAVLAIALALR